MTQRVADLVAGEKKDHNHRQHKDDMDGFRK